MYNRQTLVLSLAGILTVAVVTQSGFAQAKGPYLGQKPPGMTPEVFGPGTVSTDAHEFSLSMNPDATEIYFSRGEGPNNVKQIMVTRLEKDGWTTPAPLFPDFPNEHFEPGLTPDGKHVCFIAFQPTEGQPMAGLDMYRADREGKEWGKPYHLGAPFNPSRSMFSSFTNDGTVYTTDPQTGGMDIAFTKPTKDGFGPYENLGKPINTDGPEAYPFVAPDESYLLFCNMVDRTIKVSFRMQDGSWSQPQEVPLGMSAGTPFVSRDGKYLFFTSSTAPRQGNIYWVDFAVVRNLKPTAAR